MPPVFPPFSSSSTSTDWVVNLEYEVEEDSSFDLIRWITERYHWENKLIWHLPGKSRIFPVHIPEMRYQKMFKGIRFSIGGPKK